MELDCFDIDRLVVLEYVWLSRAEWRTGFAVVTWWQSRCLMKFTTGFNGERPIFPGCWLVRIHSDPHIESWPALERFFHRRAA